MLISFSYWFSLRKPWTILCHLGIITYHYALIINASSGSHSLPTIRPCIWSIPAQGKFNSPRYHGVPWPLTINQLASWIGIATLRNSRQPLHARNLRPPPPLNTSSRCSRIVDIDQVLNGIFPKPLYLPCWALNYLRFLGYALRVTWTGLDG